MSTTPKTWTATTELSFFEMTKPDGFSTGLILHQQWVDEGGRTEWRRVPIVKRSEQEEIRRR
jgi:hypothetical protein